MSKKSEFFAAIARRISAVAIRISKIFDFDKFSGKQNILGSGFPRQCAHWLGMTQFFDSLRKSMPEGMLFFAYNIVADEQCSPLPSAFVGEGLDPPVGRRYNGR